MAKLATSNYAQRKKQEVKDDNKKEGDDKSADDVSNKSELSVSDVLDLQAEGYSPADIKSFKDDADKMGITLKDYMGSETIMAGVKAKQEAKKTQDATPSPSEKVFKVGDTTKKFKEMDKDEKKSNFENVKRRVKK